MLLVEAHVGPSSIHGLGLISDRPVAEGAAISRFEAGLDLTLSQDQLDALPAVARRSYRYYSFRHVHSEQYVLSFDDDRFMNHSNEPSTDGCRALRAIAAGEELTYDYRRWDLDCEWKLAETPGSFARTLSGADAAARLAVLRTISRIGVRDKSVVAHVAAALSDRDRKLRYYAAKALAALGPDAGPAAEALGAALKDEDEGVRYCSAKVLFKIGPHAERVRPELMAALACDNERVSDYCSRALVNITSDTDLPSKTT